MLAGLLYSSNTPEERKRAVLAGAIVDAADVVACVVCWSMGDMEGIPALATGGGAALLVLLARLGWRSSV